MVAESSDGVPKVRSSEDGATITGAKFQTPGEGEESKMLGTPSPTHHPEFMTADMRAGISKPVMREKHIQEIQRNYRCV